MFDVLVLSQKKCPPPEGSGEGRGVCVCGIFSAVNVNIIYI
jgi:hypothetical protein